MIEKSSSPDTIEKWTEEVSEIFAGDGLPRCLVFETGRPDLERVRHDRRGSPTPLSLGRFPLGISQSKSEMRTMNGEED